MGPDSAEFAVDVLVTESADKVWTEDMRQAHRLADDIRSDTVWINRYHIITLTIPLRWLR